MNAQLYLLRTGCQWRMLPKDFPPHPTVYGYFQEFVQLRIWDDIHAVLLKMLRERMQRNAEPRLPSSTARASRAPKKGARIDAIGFDAAKKIKGVKRHIATDTQGLLLNAIVHPANVQDRDGAVDLLKGLKKALSWTQARLGRQRLQCPQAHRSLQSHGGLEARDRKALRHGEGFQCCHGAGWWSAPRLDGPQPPPRQALRGPRRDRPRIPQARHDPIMLRRLVRL